MEQFTDEVIEGLKKFIASYEPERGGALLGPDNTNLVSLFLFDPQAETTPASYKPSAKLNAKVKEQEQATGLTFKGIVHSHPGGMDRPSFQDLIAFGNNLKANPRMGRFIAPIISEGKAVKPNELDFGEGKKMSLFTAFRTTSGNQAEIEETPVSVMELDGATNDLREILAFSLKQEFETSKDSLDINGLTHMVRTLNCEKFRLDLFFPHNFPCVQPMALYSPKNGNKLGDAESLAFPWDVTCFEPEAMASRLSPAVIRKAVRGSAKTDDQTNKNTEELINVIF